MSIWQRLFGKAREQHPAQTPAKPVGKVSGESPSAVPTSTPPQNQPAAASAGQPKATLHPSVSKAIDTASPFYQEILREIAPALMERLAGDSSLSPVDVARKMITTAVLSRTKVGGGQDPMVVAHTVLISEHDEIERNAKQFAEAYAESSPGQKSAAPACATCGRSDVKLTPCMSCKKLFCDSHGTHYAGMFACPSCLSGARQSWRGQVGR
jgi:hypothetical protein